MKKKTLTHMYIVMVDHQASSSPTVTMCSNVYLMRKKRKNTDGNKGVRGVSGLSGVIISGCNNFSFKDC